MFFDVMFALEPFPASARWFVTGGLAVPTYLSVDIHPLKPLPTNVCLSERKTQEVGVMLRMRRDEGGQAQPPKVF